MRPSLFPACWALLTFFSLACGAEPVPVTIMLVGDSTVAEDGGWGPGLRASFDSSVVVTNLAANGRSSKSFRDEKRWEPVLSGKPNYVLIQFGHNDVPGKGPERETEPGTTYRANLLRYVEDVRQYGGTPVLVTSIVRRNFTPDGKVVADSLVPYVAAARALAAEQKVPLIDLYSLTRAQAEALGNRGAEAELGRLGPDGKPDHTHLGPKGKAAIGVMAARELVGLSPALAPHRHDLVAWKDALRQPKPWYSGAEAARIAENLLLYQHDNGGWEKNIDMSLPVSGADAKDVEKQRHEGMTTIDNEATYTQICFLARVGTVRAERRFTDAATRGLQYLFAAQYDNGGWPQFYPLRHGYWDHITFNDDAMVGVLETLQSIARNEPDFAFVTAGDREKAKVAVAKGIECILRTQVMVNGKLTVWCAQHDERTLAPAKARAYELPSLSGSEGVGLVRFLMSQEAPDARLRRSIDSAMAWFAASALKGMRLERRPAPDTPKGYDLVVVNDPQAPPLWARFYDLQTNQPMFVDRDGIVRRALADIGYERRNGYRWLLDRPAKLLQEEYPRWRAKWDRTAAQ